MKRISFLLLVGLLCGGAIVRAQDSGALAEAERQANEERYRRLNSSLEELWAARAALDKRIDGLVAEIRNLREEAGKPSGDYATREELKKLADAVREIDKKREADKELILKEIKSLGKSMSAAASAPPRNTTTTTPPPRSDKGYEYTIQAGDTISTVAAAYREQGIKVSTDDILAANPRLDPRKLQVGQKVWIPAP